MRRNGYGRQAQSFEAPLDVAGIAGGPFPGVFIRAPVVERSGRASRCSRRTRTVPVLVPRGAVWAATFHPELSGDLRVHQRFLQEVAQ